MSDSTIIDVTSALNAAADGKIDQLTTILLALATIGVLAFAIIEVIKVFRVRQFFNWKMFAMFLSARINGWNSMKQLDEKEKIELSNVTEELEKLAIGGDGNMLYVLPVEKLAGQINAAAQTALAYPKTYHTSIKVLASLSKNDSAIYDDINMVVAGVPAPSDSDELSKYTEARTRVSSLIQRNLDSLQTWIGWWWTVLNQVAAIVVSTLLIVWLAEWPCDSGDRVKWFFIVAFGGMIAPVAKDILAKLKKP